MTEETKLRRVHKAVHDQRFRKINIVGQDFEEPARQLRRVCGSQHNIDDDTDDDDDEDIEMLTITEILSDLLQFDGRRWKTVKLTGCRGRVDLAVGSILLSNVSRLILAAPDTVITMANNGLIMNQEQQRHQLQDSNQTTEYSRAFSVISQRLPSNTSLSTLGFHNIVLSQTDMQLLSEGLKHNNSVMDLNFHNSRFLPHAVTELARGFAAAGRRHSTSLDHLSFEHCHLSDSAITEILHGLAHGKFHSLLELSLDGNRCGPSSFAALAKFLGSEKNRLLVLDLASQEATYPPSADELIDETDTSSVSSLPLSLELPDEFCCALSTNTRLTCLHLSDNAWSVTSMTSLAGALRRNAALRRLHLAWCDLSSDLAISALAGALTENVTLAMLVLYETKISTLGLKALAAKLPAMKGLKSLDLGGSQQFDNQLGATNLLAGLGEGGNVELEQLSLPRSVVKAASGVARKLTFYTDVNRAGRRFLKCDYENRKNLTAIWPLILERAQTMELPVMYDPWWLDSDNHQNSISNDEGDTHEGRAQTNEDGIFARQPRHCVIESDGCESDFGSDIESVSESSRKEAARRASVMFYILRNGTLFQ